MGLYDNVDTGGPIPCWKCWVPLDGWQSKDGQCALMDISFRAVDNFYDVCRKCHAWNEYYRVRSTGIAALIDFQRDQSRDSDVA